MMRIIYDSKENILGKEEKTYQVKQTLERLNFETLYDLNIYLMNPAGITDSKITVRLQMEERK